MYFWMKIKLDFSVLPFRRRLGEPPFWNNYSVWRKTSLQSQMNFAIKQSLSPKTGWQEWLIFSPYGSVFENYINRPKFWLLFPTVKFDQNWVGLHFGHFFTNTSGHPASKCLLFSEMLAKRSTSFAVKIFVSPHPSRTPF
jgi:hypothetical protein